MRSRFLLLFAVALICNSTVSAQEPEWFKSIKSIKLLSATKQDIIRLFGEPEPSTYPYFKTYKLKDGNIDVEYSKGFCSIGDKEGWNVPELTVTRIFITPAKGLTPQQLGFRTKEFIKHEIEDVPGAYTFENEKDGINFSVRRTGTVEAISLYPGQGYRDLFCR